MKLYISQPVALHEIGTREVNEDYIFPEKGKANTDSRLFIVCDGLGGKQKGDVASGIVARRISDYLLALPLDADLTQFDLDQALKQAEDALSTHMQIHSGSMGMGTTLALMYIGPNRVTLAWTGNSQIYYFSSQTKTLMAADGHVLGEKASDFSSGHSMQTIHGKETPARLQLKNIQLSDLSAGDYFFLCTDGLLEKITEQDITTLLRSGQSAEKLIDEIDSLSRDHTQDNYSCYLLQVDKITKEKNGSASSKPTEKEIPAQKDNTNTSSGSEKAGSTSNTSNEDKTGDLIIAGVFISAVAIIGSILYFGNFSGSSESKALAPFEKYVQESRSLLDEGRFIEAEQKLDSAMFVATTKADSSIISNQKSNLKATEREFKDKLTMDQLIKMGDDAYAAGRYKEAQGHYEAAAERNRETKEKIPVDLYSKIAEAAIREANLLFESEEEPKDWNYIMALYRRGLRIFDESPELEPSSPELIKLARERSDYALAKRNGTSDDELKKPIATSGTPTGPKAPSTKNTGPTTSQPITDGKTQNQTQTQKTSTLRKDTRPPIARNIDPVSLANLQNGKQAFEQARMSNNQQDYRNAVHSLEMAGEALKADGQATYLLAYMYHKGLGVDQSDKIALYYARMSKQANYANGYYMYGYILVNRKGKVDRANGIEALKIASQKGNPEAKQLLARLGN